MAGKEYISNKIDSTKKHSLGMFRQACLMSSHYVVYTHTGV